MILPLTITAALPNRQLDLGALQFLRVRYATAPFKMKVGNEDLVLDMGDQFAAPALGRILVTNLNSTDDLTVDLIASGFPIDSAIYVPRTVYVGSADKTNYSTIAPGVSVTFKGVRLGLRRKQILITNGETTAANTLAVVDVSTLSGGTRLGGDVVPAGPATHTYETDSDITLYNPLISTTIHYAVGELFYCPMNYKIPTT